MSRFVEGQDRQQVTLLPECLDDFIGEDNPVRVVDAFVAHNQGRRCSSRFGGPGRPRTQVADGPEQDAVRRPAHVLGRFPDDRGALARSMIGRRRASRRATRRPSNAWR